MLQRLNIAIVGAGVAGLAVATALARSGHQVTVYERVGDVRPVGSGLLLQPTGLAALDRLGLLPAIMALGHRIERLEGQTSGGHPILSVAFADLDPGLHALAVHRAALHRTLADGFAISGARLETAAEIQRLEPGADGRLAPADAKGKVWPAADLVIDASGARSVLRAGVTDVRPRPYRYGAVWANVPDVGLAPGALAQRYVGARVMVGYLPVGRLPGGATPMAALFWSLPVAEHARWSAHFEAWRAEVVRIWPALEPVVAGLAGPDDFTLASYVHFTAPRPWRRNLVLIGDSAHATSPQLGQGANNGLIDAIVLADLLDHAKSLDDALAGYAAHRRGHVRFYQRASMVMTPLFQSDSAVLAVLRDLVFPRLRASGYLRREMVRTLAGLKTGPFSSSRAEAIIRPLGLQDARTALLEPAKGT
ncbi:MAG: FAD-dependent oxidoreductase [Hyphomicrobiaceae bacterium]